jgi:hypothetical protein
MPVYVYTGRFPFSYYIEPCRRRNIIVLFLLQFQKCHRKKKKCKIDPIKYHEGSEEGKEV